MCSAQKRQKKLKELQDRSEGVVHHVGGAEKSFTSGHVSLILGH